VEVSSGFNFLAPPDESDFDQEKELKNELGLSFGSGVEFKDQSVEIDSNTAPVVPDETVSFENSNFENNFDSTKMDLKDEPTWQQRQHQNNGQNNGQQQNQQQQPGQQRQVYRTTGHTNTSYRNSQRYQRNFENRRPNNGSGDQGSHRNVKPMRGHPGQNGGFPKRSNFDTRRGAKS
jgi:hypothetical protein